MLLYQRFDVISSVKSLFLYTKRYFRGIAMPEYHSTPLPQGFCVNTVMSFFTTRFARSALILNRRETYPYWALIYTQQGRLTFRVEDTCRDVQAGEVFFYPAGVPHSIVRVEEADWLVSFATFQCSGPMEALAGRVIVPDAALALRLQELFRMGGPWFTGLTARDGTVGMRCTADANRLLQLKSGLESALTGLYLTVQEPPRTDSVFAGAAAYMQAHLGEPLSLASLAAALNVSVSTLKKAFREESGGGVNRYYLDLRLAQGEMQLRQSSAPVSEIAERLGFCSQFYFSEQFKARYGVSPLAYRRQLARGCRELL